MKREDPLVTAVSGLGIFLVVLGHALGIEPPDRTAPIYHVIGQVNGWIYSFHMPLFFFISGYLLAHSRKGGGPTDHRQYLLKRARRLLVPYVALTLLVFLPKALLGRFALRATPLTWSALADGLLVPVHNPVLNLWFLPTLFLVTLAAPLYMRYLDGSLPQIGFTAFAVWLHLAAAARGDATLLNWTQALGYVVYFWLGMLARNYELGGALARWGWLFLAPSIVLFAVRDNRAAWDIPVAICGITFTWWAAGILLRWQDGWAVLALGKQSYQIYLFSWFGQVAARIVFLQILGLNVLLCMAISLIAGLLFPLPVSAAIRRSNIPALKAIAGL